MYRQVAPKTVRADRLDIIEFATLHLNREARYDKPLNLVLFAVRT
jgi:hypothetical protein